MDSPPLENFDTLPNRITSPALRAIAELWNTARGIRRMPSWSALPSAELSPHFKLLWGFQYDAELGEFTGRLAGENIREWINTNLYGANLKQLHPRASYAEAHQLLTRVVSTPLALRTSGCLFLSGGVVTTGERITLPIAVDGINGDGVLGASHYVGPAVKRPVEMVIHENIEWFSI
jgi:hypothetical protein